MNTTADLRLDFLDRIVEFPNGSTYELLDPITNFRHCHDGTPAEARIVFAGREIPGNSNEMKETEVVIKVKVQVPETSHSVNQELNPGPSTTSAAELKALEKFSKDQSIYAPNLVAFKQTIQGSVGLLPGGYITFTVMNKLPGKTLLDIQLSSLPAQERELVTREFLKALRSIHGLGIEPIDCALRNIMWDSETKRCTIIDFELWRESNGNELDETKELQRWGLARRPVASTWFDVWNTHSR